MLIEVYNHLAKVVRAQERVRHQDRHPNLANTGHHRLPHHRVEVDLDQVVEHVLEMCDQEVLIVEGDLVRRTVEHHRGMAEEGAPEVDLEAVVLTDHLERT